MIYTLIIEDEQLAATRLISLLKKLDAGIEIAGIVDTIESAVNWLKNHQKPDLIMLDIQLGDGISFEIFKKVKIDSHVIFTTAYDEYAIKAFELNSIDYLLKPVDENKLAISLGKYKRISSLAEKINIEKVIAAFEVRSDKFKKRFIVSIANKIKVIDTGEIAYFYSKEKNTFLCSSDNRHYPLEFSLDHIEMLVDPELFFRINRQFIVSFKTISKIEIMSKSRIRIETNPACKEEMLVSTARTSDFRDWLER
jgi:DNA-binding LytR/AlgR family response regulator